jgi:hypothetical protein
MPDRRRTDGMPKNRPSRRPRSRPSPAARPADPGSGAGRISDIEARLDAGLEETFPASDPVAIDSRSN